MQIQKTDIPGLLVIEPKVFGDDRGFFMELWQDERYREAGITQGFVQDNLSYSSRGVLRGLHFQNPNPQGKLVYVLAGEVYDVAVDIRRGSPTFGRWHAEVLSADNKRQFWVPPGMAHGFCVTSDKALFAYKCTDRYNAGAEATLAFDDPDLGIPWPAESPQLSEKDTRGYRLSELPPDLLLQYGSHP